MEDVKAKLWANVTFFAIDAEAEPEEIVDALGIDAELTETGPRRIALAETLHVGDENEGNRDRFGLFTHGGRTWIVPPSYEWAHTGRPHWLRALSRSFGTCIAFTTYYGAPSICRFENGECTIEINEFSVRPEGATLLGISEPIDDCVKILDALENYAGALLPEVFPRRGGEAQIWKRL